MTSARWRFAAHGAAGVNAPGYNRPTSNAKSGFKWLGFRNRVFTRLKAGVN